MKFKRGVLITVCAFLPFISLAVYLGQPSAVTVRADDSVHYNICDFSLSGLPPSTTGLLKLYGIGWTQTKANVSSNFFGKASISVPYCVSDISDKAPCITGTYYYSFMTRSSEIPLGGFSVKCR